MNDLGARIRRVRIWRDESLEQVAKALGMSKQALSKIERGDHAPTVATLRALAVHFNVPSDALLGLAPRLSVLAKMPPAERHAYLITSDLETTDD